MKREQLKKALKPVIVECVEPAPPPRPKLNETRKQLLEAVSAGAYNGIDLFEGVTPAPAPSSPTAPGDPLSDADPTDPGIDISGIMSVGGKKWKALSGRN